MVVQWCSIVWDAPTLVISSHFEFEAMLIFSSNFLRMLTQLIQQFLFFPFFFSYFCLHFLLSHNWEKKGSIRYSIGTCHNFFHAMIMSKTGKQTYIWHQEIECQCLTLHPYLLETLEKDQIPLDSTFAKSLVGMGTGQCILHNFVPRTAWLGMCYAYAIPSQKETRLKKSVSWKFSIFK